MSRKYAQGIMRLLPKRTVMQKAALQKKSVCVAIAPDDADHPFGPVLVGWRECGRLAHIAPFQQLDVQTRSEVSFVFSSLALCKVQSSSGQQGEPPSYRSFGDS